MMRQPFSWLLAANYFTFLFSFGLFLTPSISNARISDTVFVDYNASVTHTTSNPDEPNRYYIDAAVKDLPSQREMRNEAVFHLFSHGKPGFLLLEGQWRNSPEIAEWLSSKDFLKEKKHLNIYGCNFAQGEKGRKAVAYLEAALGVSVAASDDVTGVDGDWELEVGKAKNVLVLPNYSHNLTEKPVLENWVAINCTATATQIRGTVFEDYDYDGFKDANELVGVASIAVRATDALGNNFTTVTDASGNYTLNGLVAAMAYRVEFTNIPSWASPTFVGVDNGTTVQFVQSGNCANLSLASSPDYCQANPRVLTTCYIENSLTAQTGLEAIIDFTYTGTNKRSLVTGEKIGSTWGVAYSSQTKKAYVSAVLKRHTELGLQGIGGIYEIDYSPTTPTFTAFMQVPNVGTNPRTTALPNTVGAPSADPQVFTSIGKVGVGDIEVSEDGQTLYVMNLGNKRVDIINVATKTVIQSIDIPNPGCSSGTYRPWALKLYKGIIYAGVVCDNASTAFVYQQTGSTFTLLDLNSLTTASGFALNYIREGVWSNGYAGTQGCNSINQGIQARQWNGWIDTYPALTCTNPFSDGVDYIMYPQPILTDIEFDDNGSIILGFMDRMGMQGGSEQYNLSGVGKHTVMSGGDIIRICKSGTNFIPEGSAGCAQNDTGNDTPPAEFATHDDGAEFYVGDDWIQIATGNKEHLETAFGSLALRRGSGQVITSVYDPIVGSANAGGFKWLSNSTGASSFAYEIYNVASTGTFAKSAGLGDVELICQPAPIQIGNYVWSDTDKDGVQDPGEAALNAITVSLWKGGTQIATTTTNSNGYYYFSSKYILGAAWTGTGADTTLLPYTAYEVRISMSQSGITTPNYQLTTANSTINLGDDQNDSDASISSGNAVIAFTTGDVGSVNHTYDFGFFSCPTITNPSATQTLCLGTTGSNITINTSYNTANGIRFVRFASNQSTTNGSETATELANIYAGTAILTVTPTGASSPYTATYTFNAADFPTAGTYYVYAILNPDQGALCRPVQEIIVTVNPLPSFTLTQTAPTCTSATANNNGKITLSAVTNGTHYGVSTLGAATYNGNAFASATAISGMPDVQTNIPNTGGSYIIRIFNGSNICFTDQTVTVAAVLCNPCLAGNIGGKAWHDFTSDGVKDALETSGVSNLTVKAFDCNGNLVATTTTDASGYYQFTGLTPSATNKYRIEFSNLPSGYVPTFNGVDGKTDVQFVTAASCEVNFGVNQKCTPIASNQILQSGYSAVTCLPGADNVVLAVKDIRTLGTLWDSPSNRNVNQSSNVATKNTWMLSDFGGYKVFGLTIDQRNGTIYVGTSEMVADVQHSGGTILSANVPARIYKIGPISTTPVLLATLPGSLGVGGLEIDTLNNQVFAVSMDDGKIYRLNATSGTLLQTYDPLTPDNASVQTVPPLGDAIWGLGFNHSERKLYYSVWENNAYVTNFFGPATTNQNKIRSVAVEVDGSFNLASDALAMTIPFTGTFKYSHPVSDIEFNAAGDKVLLAESGINLNDSGLYLPGSHDSRLTEWQKTGSTWTMAPVISGNFSSKYDVGNQSLYKGLNSRGGASWAYRSVTNNVIDGDEAFVLTTADAIHLPSGGDSDWVYGYQMFPSTGGNNSNSMIVNLTSTTATGTKYTYNDVEIYKGNACASGVEIGNYVWVDNNQNGVQDPCELPLSGVEVNLKQGATVVATTKTDNNGNYYFGGSDNQGFTFENTGTSAQTYTQQITDSNNDARQNTSGVNAGASGLLFNDRYLGLRFPRVDIPKSAIITSASIRFTASGAGNIDNVTIVGEKNPNATLWVNGAAPDISNRFTGDPTTASVNWTNATSWVVAASGAAQTTPDLTSIIAEIIALPIWERDKSLNFIFQAPVNASGATAFDVTASASSGAVLTINFTGTTQTTGGNLLPNTNYTICIPLSQTPITSQNLKPTATNSTLANGNDANDSDGVTVGTNIELSIVTPDLGSNHTFDFGFFPCSNILTPSAAQIICVGTTGSNITVTTNQNTASSIKFVQFTADQMAGASPTATEATAIYAGTAIGSAVTPSGGTSPYTATYTWNSADFPNATNAAITYYVYAIIEPDGGATCRPTQEIQITISPLVSAGTPTNPAPICQNVSGLTNVALFGQLAGEMTGGVWSQTAGTSVGTALDAVTGIFNPNGIASGTYTFRYTVTGIAPCPNDMKDVTIIIQNCCPPKICLPVTVTRN